MDKLLPPLLVCSSTVPDAMWQSQVIPAYAVRPKPDGEAFSGFQLQAFAKKTKRGHVVFDMQLCQQKYYRYANFLCLCDPAGGSSVGYGRCNLKDDFLAGGKGLAVRELQLCFYENNICQVRPVFGIGAQRDFPIVVNVARGFDMVGRSDADHNALRFRFSEGGKSFRVWLQRVVKEA